MCARPHGPGRHGFFRLYLGFLCLIVHPGTQGQQPLAHIDINDGLSHNTVYAIGQDHAGFIWFGTADGLNRFDGYEFRIYRHSSADESGLLGNTVKSILVDNAGRLWVGTELGINRYLPEHDSFAHYRLDSEGGRAGHRNSVEALHEAHNGTLRAGTRSGQFVYLPSDDRFVREHGRIGSPEMALIDIRQAPDGAIWSLARHRDNRLFLTRRTEGVEAEFHWLSAQWGDPWAFVIDRNGQTWFHYEAGKLEGDSRPIPAGPLPQPRINAAIESHDGRLWFGTSNGLVIVDPATQTSRHVYLDDRDRSWLRNYVRSIFQDADGSVWVGSYTGVYRHDPGARPFRALQHDPGDTATLGGSAVSSIVGDQDRFWIGTFGGGISVIDRHHGGVRHHRHDPDRSASLPDNVVWHLLLDGQTLWIATLRGLARLDTATGQMERMPAVSEDNVFHIVRGAGENLWLATRLGLLRFNPVMQIIEPLDPPAEVASDQASGIDFRPIVLWYDDARNELWVGTELGALYRLDTVEKRYSKVELRTGDAGELYGEGIWDLCPDDRGGLWVAHGAGLSHIERNSGVAEHFGIAAGLPGSVVYSAALDEHGELWLGTNRGLAHFDPDEAGVNRTYSRADGLPYMEFNRHARWSDEDGTLYFGGIDGITWFDPLQVQPNRRPPRVVLTDVSRLGAEDIQPINPHGLDRLVLQPNDYGFSVRFAALNFVNPAQNRHAYRLLDIEENWISADTSRTARYTSLPPGAYTLQLRGSNNDGVWSQAPTSLDIEVIPSFRQTLWFPISLVTAAGLLILLVWRLRLAQLRRLEQVRLAIAADLHDDLSADLGGIGVAAEMLASRRERNDEERELLDEMARSAHDSGSALRDLIWYINPDLDTLEALVDRMRSIAGVMLQRHDVIIQAEVREGSRRLPMMARRNIVLIYKEALHNIVRHADAEQIRIGIDQHSEQLRVTVRDDGCGFDPDRVGLGLGIRNMHRRAEAIGAKVHFDSRPGHGSQVELTVPLTEIRDGRWTRIMARFRRLFAGEAGHGQ